MKWDDYDATPGWVKLLLLASLCTLATSSITSAQSTSISFKDGVDGYAGTRDAILKFNSLDTNYGSDTEISLDSSPDEAGLLYWDLTSIPSGRTVGSVDITVNVTNNSTGEFELYELKKNWVESQVTWNEFASGQGWQVGGALGALDHGSTVLGAIVGSSLGPSTISLNAAGIAVVQGWIDDPSSNRGFVIQDYVNHTDDLRFSSRESAPIERPELIVTMVGGEEPTLLIDRATVLEGDAGTVNAIFTVKLTDSSDQTVTVDYATAGNTATSGVDYVAVSGQLIFQPGETSHPVTVQVKGDMDDEGTETFFVNLSNPVNAPIYNNQGIGTILDDDALLPGEAITFSVTGDYPYGPDELADLQEDMEYHNLYSPSKFYFHVGDILAGIESCFEQRYLDVASALNTLAVPAFIIPGDNEWTDCADPAQGFQWWENSFSNFEQNYCRPPAVDHQTVRNENWAFVSKGVLFLGINIPDGKVDDSEELSRLQDNADWVDFHLQGKVDQVRAAIVIGHAGPTTKRNLFFDQFVASSVAFGKPVIYIMGNNHVWTLDNPWPAPNMHRLIVNRAHDEDPPQITVTMDQNNPFEIVRNPWSNNPQVLNARPCVDAGSDQTISQLQTLNLNGIATDDGVPVNPGSLTTTWSKMSGPGNVVFGDANALITTASFSTGGLYNLRLSAADGQLITTDELTVNVEGASELVTVSFQDGTGGYTGTRDAVLMADSSTTNFGSRPEGELDGDPDKSTLLFWYVTAIPIGSLVESVDIIVNVTNTSGATYEIYDVKRAWDEHEVTWNESTSGQSWQVAGADGSQDRGTTVFGAFTAPNIGPTTISLNAEGVAAVQAWVNDPSSNHGFVVQDYINHRNGLNFSLREVPTASNRPMLKVTYEGSGSGEPALSIDNATVTEGNSGTTDATFTVTLSYAGTETVTVNYSTADGTATTAGNDYNTASGPLSFAPGVTSQQITVQVKGDTAEEGDETFFVNLTGAAGATIGDGQGKGTITNDDQAEPDGLQVTSGPLEVTGEMNDTGKLDPGETANLTLAIENAAETVLKDVTVTMSGDNTRAKDHVTIHTEPIVVGSIEAGASMEISFNVSLAEEAPIESSYRFLFQIAGDAGSIEFTKTIYSGNEPIIELPVELIAFDATMSGSDVVLDWKTASERGNAGFRIERSYNDGPFEELAFVEGAGTTSTEHSYRYVASNVDPGRHGFRLRQIDFDGAFELSEVIFVELIPQDYDLKQNFPNPFNPQTRITYHLPVSGRVTLEVFDVLGRRVSLLVDELREAGRHEVLFDAADLPNGSYLYRLKAGTYQKSKVMLLLK